MRVFALSDIHVDFPDNESWIESLSTRDYRDDILILAGDPSDSRGHLHRCFDTFVRRFRKVLYVPGNHDLWVIREKIGSSFDKFLQVCDLAQDCGIPICPTQVGDVSVIPLFSWYHYSFRSSGEDILSTWMDFHACAWPEGLGAQEITAYFRQLNEPVLVPYDGTIITPSHFLPRVDLMLSFLPPACRSMDPVLGTERLDRQIRMVQSNIHVYGHGHVNRRIVVDGITYVNNAFGYPHEQRIATKQLICIRQDG